MRILEAVADLLKDVEKIRATTKALNIYIYDAEYDKVKKLVLEKGYRLGAVCGTKEGYVRAFACKTVKLNGFEISSSIYSENVEMKEYMKLRKIARTV
jgi:hypothetical protein